MKRVDSVEGLVCLPWHKDCERGGHSMFCSGLTVGICLTPVDEAHGGLDVVAGSHRANIARAQVDRDARPAARHAPSRSRRPHRAHVVRAAPVDASREPRAARRLHGLRAAAPARRRPRATTRKPRLRQRACRDRRPEHARAARVRDRARSVPALTTRLGRDRCGRRDGFGVRARAGARSVDVVLLTDIDDERLARGRGARRARDGARRCAPRSATWAIPRSSSTLAARAGALGDLHSLVHTAGLSPSMAGWREILRVDLVAVARLLDAFLPRVGRRAAWRCAWPRCRATWARSIRRWTRCSTTRSPPISRTRFQSLAGDDPDPGATYRLAKRGVIRLCERAAVEWGARGGRVVSLSPGLIDTEMGRLELRAQPDQDVDGRDHAGRRRPVGIRHRASRARRRHREHGRVPLLRPGGVRLRVRHPRRRRPDRGDEPAAVSDESTEPRTLTGDGSGRRRARAREPGDRRGAHRDRPASLPRGHGVGRAAAGHAVPRARRRRLGLRRAVGPPGLSRRDRRFDHARVRRRRRGRRTDPAARLRRARERRHLARGVPGDRAALRLLRRLAARVGARDGLLPGRRAASTPSPRANRPGRARVTPRTARSGQANRRRERSVPRRRTSTAPRRVGSGRPPAGPSGARPGSREPTLRTPRAGWCHDRRG